MSAIFSSFYKNVTTPGTPVALGTSATKFNSAFIIPRKSESEDNAGNIKIKLADGVGQIIRSPGSSAYTIAAPLNTAYTADQFKIDADTAGDGALVVYTFAQFSTFHSIEMKLEAAMSGLVNTIAATIDDCSITTGLSEESRTGDNVRCYVTDAAEEILDSALWRCTANVYIQTRIDQTDALTLHQLRTAYVRDLFMDEETENLLTALEPNFTVQQNSITNRKLESGVDTEGRKYFSRFSFEICCCGTQIVG